MAACLVGLAAVGDGAYRLIAVLLSTLGFGFGLAITPGTQLIIDALPAEAAPAAREGIAGALAVAGRLRPHGAQPAESATTALTSGYVVALLVAAGALVLGAVTTAVLAPHRGTAPATEAEQDTVDRETVGTRA